MGSLPVHRVHCAAECAEGEDGQHLPQDIQVSYPELEITEIMLAKVSRLCQLSSHSRGFLSRLQIFKYIGPTVAYEFFGAQDTIL